MSDFRVTSNSFKEGATLPTAHVYNGFGHNGGNVSPHLAWAGVPDGTKSFVVNVYDPDAPTGSGFWHWTIVDIPADVRELKLNASADGLPPGSRQTRNDMGSRDYVGAAPPPGPAHRYIFTVHALSVDKLPVPDDASGALVGFMAGMNTLGKASLTATYGA